MKTMSESRSLPQGHTSQPSRWLPVAVIVIAVLVFGVGFVVFKHRGPNEQAAQTASSPSSSAWTSPTQEITTASPTSEDPTPSLTAHRSSNTRVSKDANSGKAPGGTGQFTMTGPATIRGATYDVMPYQLPLNPAGPQSTMVRWVNGLGVSPRNARKGTVYVLGHAWGTAPLVFNPISEKVTATVNRNRPPVKINGTDNKPVKRYSSKVLNGSRIKMQDSRGNARMWRVTRSWLVPKTDAIADPDVMAQKRPGRIILIACAVSGDRDLGYNVIVEGKLA